MITFSEGLPAEIQGVIRNDSPVSDKEAEEPTLYARLRSLEAQLKRHQQEIAKLQFRLSGRGRI